MDLRRSCMMPIGVGLAGLPPTTIRCRYCNQEARETGLCDSCWELHSRIKRQPELARRMLKEVEPVHYVASLGGVSCGIPAVDVYYASSDPGEVTCKKCKAKFPKTCPAELPTDRWAPYKALNKAQCRRKGIQTVLKHYSKPDSKLHVISLCGAIPFTEQALVSYRNNIRFDLVEKDPQVADFIVSQLKTDFKDVGDHCTLYNNELEEFLAHPSNQHKKYHVAILDMMGGWCPGYANIFDWLVLKHLHLGAIILFTYNPNWRFSGKAANHGEIPYPVEELTTRFPLEILWVNDYNDSQAANNAMRTIALKLVVPHQGGSPASMITTEYPYVSYNEVEALQKDGWLSPSDIPGIDRTRAGVVSKRLRLNGIPHKKLTYMVPGKNHITQRTYFRMTLDQMKATLGDKFPVISGKKLTTETLDAIRNPAPKSKTESKPTRVQVTHPEALAEVPVPSKPVQPAAITSTTQVNGLDLLKAEDPHMYRALVLMSAMQQLNLVQ